MSLKAIHLLFIIVFGTLAFGFAAWELAGFFSEQGTSGNLWLGIGGIVVGIAIIFYGIQFRKKLKRVSYL